MRYRTTILLGAFLLFQIQPQIARVILPWFGGGPAVWSACLLFFQAQLLAGYAYAHLLHRYLAPRAQAILHVALLAAALFFLPIVPGDSWRPTGAEQPTLHILLLLGATVGLPYLLLAATGPLIQSWIAQQFAGRSPYRLYALSNVGSLAALLSFPFVFEPHLSIGVQADAWAASFALFFVLTGACAWSYARARLPGKAGSTPVACVSRTPDPVPVGASAQGAPALAVFASAPAFTAGLDGAVAAQVRAEITELVGDATSAAPSAAGERTGPGTPPHHVPQLRRWVVLAALPSLMLLAVTNVISVDIAVTPFLWVVPLALYLSTFILTFDSERWYRPAVMGASLAVLAVLLLFFAEATWFTGSIGLQVGAFCAVLFLCGMVCHGELVRHKPGPEHLTGFYLCVAVGGALGGLLVAVVAPLLFDTYLELEIGLALSAIFGTFACVQRVADAEARSRMLRRRALPFAAGVALAGAVVVRASDPSHCLERSRNFFGRITVQDVLERDPDDPETIWRVRRLRHGSTLHGEQHLGENAEPGRGHTYFGAESGVAHALRHHPAAATRPLRVGIVGLGTGTLAHYARAKDHYTFYEIDPAMLRVAETHFTYIAAARGRGATIDMRVGDARIGMERELARGRAERFDVLVVDAFSSDSIPMHLLTREANRIYWQRLTKNGILLIHISNRTFDLLPIVRGLARDAKRDLRVVTVRSEAARTRIGSAWTIITGNRRFLALDRMSAAAAAGPDAPGGSLLWTDDFSSLWHVMR